jgi:hypothetical protein
MHRDGSSPYNLRVYFDPEESANPYEIVINHGAAREKFVKEFEKMVNRCHILDKIADEFGMVYSDTEGKYIEKAKRYYPPLFRLDEEFPETLPEN